MIDDITLCTGCESMTHGIRKGGVHYVCDKCCYEKSLGDYYQYELQQKRVGRKF